MNEHDPESFAHQLLLRGEGGRYEAHIGEAWSQGRAGYGGMIAAQLARALDQVVASDRLLRSALIDFVAPAAPGPAQIEATILRVGRALTHAEARMRQGHDVVAVFVGTYGAKRPSQVQHPGASAKPTPPIAQLPRLPYVEGLMPRFTQYFEYRTSSPYLPFSGSEHGIIEGYVRHPKGGPVDASGLFGLIDAWPPAILPLIKKPAPASSVTWMVDFFAPVSPPGTHSDEFFRYEAYTVAAGDGYGSCEARVWTPGGALVAASRQMVVEFSG